MSQNRPDLAVLIPCYNEETTLPQTIQDYRKVFSEALVVVCDNASTDQTAKIARDQGAVVFSERRRGKGYAVRTLFSNVNASYYILTDGDHTYRAEDAKKLLEVVKTQRADMAVGDRMSGGGYALGKTRPFHQFGNRLISRLISVFFRVPVKDPLSGLRVMNEKFVRTIPLISAGFEVETELTTQAIDKGFIIEEIPISYDDRPAGNPSKLKTVTDGFKIIMTFVRFLLYFKPLTLSLSVALFSFLMSVALGIGPVTEYLVFQYVYKVPSLIVAVAFFSIGLLSFFLGFLFEVLRYSRMENFLLMSNSFQASQKNP